MRALWVPLSLLVACTPSSTSTDWPMSFDAGPDDAGTPVCDGCSPCDGGTSRDGGPCCTGCWDSDLCALFSNELTCGEHGTICKQCVDRLVCDAGACVKP